MQVSWIDPDEVRGLLRQLEGPKKGAGASAWELNTLPASSVRHPPVDLLIAEGSDATSTPPAPPPVEHPLAEPRQAPPNAELWRIREHLRALREKAQTSGMLSRIGTDEPAVEVAEEVPTPIENLAVPIEAGNDDVAEPPIESTEDTVEPSSQDSDLAAPAFEDDTRLAGEVKAPVGAHNPFEQPAASQVYEPLFAASTSTPSLAELALDDSASSLAAEPQDETEQAPFVVPTLGLSDRLSAVATWVCQRLGTQEILLVDDYGDVLWGAQGHTALVLSAMMAWHSTQRASAVATCIDPERIDKTLAGDRVLTVLPVRTRYGVVSLAAIQDKPMSGPDATAIREALALAVEGPDGPQTNEAA